MKTKESPIEIFERRIRRLDSYIDALKKRTSPEEFADVENEVADALNVVYELFEHFFARRLGNSNHKTNRQNAYLVDTQGEVVGGLCWVRGELVHRIEQHSNTTETAGYGEMPYGRGPYGGGWHWANNPNSATDKYTERADWYQSKVEEKVLVRPLTEGSIWFKMELQRQIHEGLLHNDPVA